MKKLILVLLVPFGLILAAIAVPNYLEARKHARIRQNIERVARMQHAHKEAQSAKRRQMQEVPAREAPIDAPFEEQEDASPDHPHATAAAAARCKADKEMLAMMTHNHTADQGVQAVAHEVQGVAEKVRRVAEEVHQMGSQVPQEVTSALVNMPSSRNITIRRTHSSPNGITITSPNGMVTRYNESQVKSGFAWAAIIFPGLIFLVLAVGFVVFVVVVRALVRSGSARNVGEGDARRMQDLHRLQERIGQRIESLESLLLK